MATDEVGQDAWVVDFESVVEVIVHGYLDAPSTPGEDMDTNQVGASCVLHFIHDVSMLLICSFNYYK